MQWKFEGSWPKTGTYRRATEAEIAALIEQPGAPHVLFGCECGKGIWHAKNLTLTDKGRYNGMRNIFFAGTGMECDCPSSKLVCIVEE